VIAGREAREGDSMKHPWNRREFVTRPLTLFAAAQLLKRPDLLFAEQASAGAPAAQVRKPIVRPLGKTGVSLPVVSAGAAQGAALIKRSYELGVRCFDTAASYGNGQNETLLSSTLKEMEVRDKVLVVTKIDLPMAMRQSSTGMSAADLKAAMLESLDSSLKRMGLDYVDVVLQHAASTTESVRLDGALEALNAMKKSGKARFIGISSHSGQQEVLTAMTELGVHDVAMIGINRTMAASAGMIAAMDAAAKKGIGIIGFKSLAGGMPGGPPGGGGQGGPPGSPMQGGGQAGAQGGPPGSPQQGGGQGGPPGGGRQSVTVTNPTALIKWVLQHESVATVITNYSTFEQMEQNFSVAYDLAYTDSEKKFLADDKAVAALEFCQQCGSCRSGCELRADIPTLMRSHMYALQYRDTEKARYTLASIPKGKGLEACANCETCNARCANTVNIARKIGELKGLSIA
jgi:uncharacterized protein